MTDDRPLDQAETKQQPTLQELERLRELLATPIDFDRLVADGIIKRHGAWWQVLDTARLPEHARVKIRTVAGASLVQFAEPPRSQRGKKK
jgi:hypothetical protein